MPGSVARSFWGSILLLSCLVLTLAGCGKKEPGASTGAAARPAGAAASGHVFPLSTVKNCAAFTPAAAAEILAVPAADVKEDSQDLYETARTCAFASRKEPRKAVVFTLRRDETVADANAEMTNLRSNLEIAAHTPAGKGAAGAYSEIMGLGDDAVWSGVNNSLTVRRGNLTVLVMSPSDKKVQAAVAQKVLEGLR